jgi:hypothetical protein
LNRPWAEADEALAAHANVRTVRRVKILEKPRRAESIIPKASVF